MRRRPAVVLLSLVSLLVFAGTTAGSARAQGTADSTAADVLFEQGRVALAKGDVATACDRFEASRKLEPATGTLLNLADCQTKLDRRKAAWIAFREALRSMAPNDDRRAYAERRIAELETKLARVELRWSGPPVNGSTVTINDEPIAPPYDAPRIVDPGKLVVAVNAPGRRARTFEGAATEGRSVTIDVAPGEATTQTATAPATAGDAADAPSGGRRVLGFAVGGVGLAALGAGAYFGVSALGANADAKSRCGGGVACPDDASLAASRADADTASTHATVATVLLAAGAVLAGTGIYLIVTSSSNARPRSQVARMPLRFEF